MIAEQAMPRSPPRKFDHLSFSSVSLFQLCPLRWYFKYSLGLPENTTSSSLVLGSALHACVQFHFEQLLMGRTTPDLDTLLAVFQDSWESFDDKIIRYAAGESRDEIGRLADRLLKEFLRSEFSRPKGEIIGIEEELRGKVIPGVPDLLGRVDLIVDAGDQLVISDFKTARCTWNDFKVEDVAPQLLLYSELVKPMTDGRPIKLEFAVLTKTKVPVLTIHDVPLDPQQVERTKKIVERVWQAIQAGYFYPCVTCLIMWYSQGFFPKSLQYGLHIGHISALSLRRTSSVFQQRRFDVVELFVELNRSAVDGFHFLAHG
jgi:RecB family exonuclease